MKTKTATKEEGIRLNLSQFPNFSATGSMIGMKNKYYGKDALLIKCGAYIYNVDSSTYNAVQRQ